MENLGGVHHVVLLADSLAESRMLVSRESGHDTVNQRGTEIVLIL